MAAKASDNAAPRSDRDGGPGTTSKVGHRTAGQTSVFVVDRDTLIHPTDVDCDPAVEQPTRGHAPNTPVDNDDNDFDSNAADSNHDVASNEIASNAADGYDNSSALVARPAGSAPVAAPSPALSLPSPASVSSLVLPDTGAAGWANRRLAPSVMGIIDFRQWPPVCTVNGRPEPIETLERLACESYLYRLVLDAKGALIDLGGTARFASPAQYKALLALDKHCSAPRCRTPGKWSVVHHIVAFPKGPTAWRNMVLLCDRHHHLVHEGGWQVQRDPSNLARIIWIDPTGQPRPPPPG